MLHNSGPESEKHMSSDTGLRAWESAEQIRIVFEDHLCIFIFWELYNVEQNAEMALSVADRAYVMETGLITLSGTGKELAASEAVRKAYLGGWQNKQATE